MRTFLVAVSAASHQDVHDFLKASTLGPASEEGSIDCWWVAEDDREDGSDCDSAIFIPRGAQEDMYNLISQYFDAHKEEWDEEGYPYSGTDVSGAFYLPRTQRQLNRFEVPNLKKPRGSFSWVSFRRRECEAADGFFIFGAQMCGHLTRRRIRAHGKFVPWCGDHQ